MPLPSLERRRQIEGSPSPISSPFTPPRYSPKPSPLHSSPKRSKSPKRSPKRIPNVSAPIKISSFFLDDIKKVKLRKTVQDKKEKEASAMKKLFEGRLQAMTRGKKENTKSSTR